MEDHPNRKSQLDEYDYKLREAILRDGVPIRSLTAWELRRLQLILDIDNHQIILPEALRSDFLKEIDYIPLWRLLEAKQWQAANEKTCRLMVEVAQRNRFQQLWQTKEWQKANDATRQSLLGKAAQPIGSVGLTDLKNFPCVDLLTMDYLWLWFSDGHFGFSVQSQIWRWLDADLNEFARQVEWLTQNGWIASNQLKGLPKAERGHLPFVLPIFQLAPQQDWETYTTTCLNELPQKLASCPIHVAS